MKPCEIAVIVPVHNAAAFLTACTDAIAAQKFDAFRCILVDDGSTDGSPALCDAIAAGDQRFVAMHQPNSGVCAARTAGLRRAQELGARWFLVAMVDVLERMDEMLYYEYRAIMSMLKDTVDAMIAFQDAESGMFWQVIDKAGVEGNYLETSGSALFAYAVLKGVRLGYLPKRYAAYGEKAFYGTCDRHLGVGADGALQLGGICLVAGLGGATRRDGSLAYYFSEPIVENDAKGVGPLLLAYTEILAAQKQ